jgi:hypothetical protein
MRTPSIASQNGRSLKITHGGDAANVRDCPDRTRAGFAIDTSDPFCRSSAQGQEEARTLIWRLSNALYGGMRFGLLTIVRRGRACCRSPLRRSRLDDLWRGPRMVEYQPHFGGSEGQKISASCEHRNKMRMPCVDCLSGTSLSSRGGRAGTSCFKQAFFPQVVRFNPSDGTFVVSP